MNKNKIIRLTNLISLTSIILLLYWVFIFVSIQVFGFKVFRENITESFYLSIIGILSLLTGAVIVNVMFNLTKISDVMSGEYDKKSSAVKMFRKPVVYLFVLSFPVLFLLLYVGDLNSSNKKEEYLVNSARYIVDNNPKLISEFAEFKFDSTYLSGITESLAILSQEYESFPTISLIYQTKEKGKDIFVNISSYFQWRKEYKLIHNIFSCSVEEKEYLTEVFQSKFNNPKFSAHDGNYELYYPVKTEEGTFVLYCTDRQSYGKFGS